MTSLQIASTSAGVFAILSIVLFIMVVRSGSRPTVLRGILRVREVVIGKSRIQEHYERDTLKMTFNVETQPDKETLTINAEGSADDVEHVTGVLKDILAANAANVSGPVRRAGDANRLRSEFTVVRRTRKDQTPAVEAQVDFSIVRRVGDETGIIEG